MVLVSLATCLTVTGARAASAQQVTGAVTSGSSGMVVVLVDTLGTTAAWGLTDSNGRFALTAPGAGAYRVRALRIGYRPVESAPFPMLVPGSVTGVTIAMPSILVALDTVRVTSGRSVCRAAGAASANAFLVWDQARTALLATSLAADTTLRDGPAATQEVTTVAYERVLEAVRNRVVEQRLDVSMAPAASAWRSAPPDSIAQSGYVTVARDGERTYLAPGLSVLASDRFILDHCFRLVPPRSTSVRVGVAFEPAPSRRGVAEIKGIAWLGDSGLRTIDFEYVGDRGAGDDDITGRGMMEFASMRGGRWFIVHWELQLPIVSLYERPHGIGGGSGWRRTGTRVAGGDLHLVVDGADTLWARPGIAVRGQVTDSSGRTPAVGATVALIGTSLAATTDSLGQFRFGNLIAGEYVVETRTPSLDSVGITHRATLALTSVPPPPLRLRVPTATQVATTICGRSARGRLAVGTVRFVEGGDTLPAASVRIVAEWKGGTAAGTDRWAEAHTDERGRYRLCGLPTDGGVSIRVDGADSLDAGARITVGAPQAARVVPASFVLRSRVGALAAFAGVVTDSTSGTPIAAAEVLIPSVNRITVTASDGSFRIGALAPGRYDVLVRHIGHGPLNASVALGIGPTIYQRIVLPRVTVLNTVVTEANSTIRSFEDNMRVGLGHFLTRAELEPQEGRRLSEVIAQFPGVRMVQGNANRAFLSTSRGPRSISVSAHSFEGGVPYPPLFTMYQCYAQVYIDRARYYGGGGTEPVPDINRIPVAHIEAIEYYASAAQMPADYSGLNSQCGVLVIHTRMNR